MARVSLDILDRLVGEDRAPTDGEYKTLVEELMVHYKREQSDGPTVDGIVWPNTFAFAEEDSAQIRIDKMARRFTECLNQRNEMVAMTERMLGQLRTVQTTRRPELGLDPPELRVPRPVSQRRSERLQMRRLLYARLQME